jgi:hypothetical protein
LMSTPSALPAKAGLRQKEMVSFHVAFFSKRITS